MRKEKGITLIALIMTIILLLILVGVSLNLLIKGDLFGSAEKAVSGTNAKTEEQQTRVDELMGQMDRANVFAEGTVPTLKYKVYGDNIIVYLEHSLYDYVSKMSIEEKEKKLANAISIESGYLNDTYYKSVSNSTTEKFIAKTAAISNNKYSNIDDLINDRFNGDRKNFEACLALETGNYISYEEALNFYLMRSPYASIWFCSEFAENVLHLKNNLSVNEKEKRIANIAGWSLTQVQVRVQDEANNFGIPYSKCLDIYLNAIAMEELGEEEIEQANRVTLTLPTGESGPFYYGGGRFNPRIEEESYVQTNNVPSTNYYYYFINIMNVKTNGRYKYTAENHKGTKAEVTVPVELRTANFKVKVSDTETKTYEFIEGQSWGLFIGLENEYNVMSDNYAFGRENEDVYVEYAYYNLSAKLKNERYKIASLNMPKLKVAETDSTSERRLFKTDIILFALNKGKN